MTVPTSGTGRIATGVQNVYGAEVLSDTNGGSTSYDTPFKLDGVTDNIDVTQNDSIETYYGDNRAAAQANSRGDIEVTISRQSLDNEQEAFILGKTIVNGYIEDKTTDIPPDLALMFEITYNDGASKFVQLDKGKFLEANISASTKTDTTEFQSDELTGTFISRNSDGRRKRSKIVSKNDVESFRTTFFDNANDSSVVTLTLTTSPEDADTGITVSSNIVLTYNNAMQSDTVNNSNIKLLKASDGTEIELTFSSDAAKEVFTISHNDLEASTAYILIVTDNVRDVFGQGIEQIVNFTTA
ncbi:MAG: hypothetical protein FH761_16605 [Firmicutes bacterium]|nr:hypothetical protein [Bacillota bacterium]